MRIDMHVHSEYSKDCKTTIQEILKKANSKGLDGIAITDHNEIEGALKAEKLSRDILVIVGEEIKTLQGEILVYFPKRRIKPGLDIMDTIRIARNQGCLIGLPHPFDSRRSGALRNEEVRRSLKGKIDFIEINGKSLPKSNMRAREYAKNNKIPIIAGSDAHTLREIGSAYTEFPDGKINKNTRIFYKGSTIRVLPGIILRRISRALK